MRRLALVNLRTRQLGPLNLVLGPGRTCLRGPSGSGKTLLLRAIADLDPHQGEVCLDDTPRSHLPAPQWRRWVLYLPAESHWWRERVGDHFPAPVPALLEALGFGAEVLNWEVSRLSSGERQRLALARGLALGPAMLLLDEPTANLDADNRRRVEDLIVRFMDDNGAGALWVSHDPEQRQRMGTRQYRIQEGALVEESP